jgi:hypothetical protein
LFKQRLSFFSGAPTLIMPNAASKLIKMNLDGQPVSYTTKRGHNVHASGITSDYHLYIMASRLSSSFSENVVWDKARKKIKCEIIFHTYPKATHVQAEIILDGSSPYPIPSVLELNNIESVKAARYTNQGFHVGLEFIYSNIDKTKSFLLNSDLMPFLKLINAPANLCDFHVEYLGIACGPNGNSNVFKRANAHEKAAEIQSDLIQRSGNRALYIFTYNPEFLISSKGFAVQAFTSGNVVAAMVKGGLNTLYEVMEASLISYFKPEYNIQFKDFPNTKPNWLDNGFGSINGGFLTIDEIEVTLFSDCSSFVNNPWKFGDLHSQNRPGRGVHNFKVML